MTIPVRTVADEERRARLGVRHALATPVDSPEAAAAAVVCLHATEPASVYVSAFARAGASRGEVDNSLYVDRTLIKQLAMRRTLFAFPRELLPVVLGSASARVALQQADLLARSAVAGGLTSDGAAWAQDACEQTYAMVQRHPASTDQLRAALPVLQQRLRAPERPRSAAPTPVASRVLTVLAATGVVVRGANRGGWTTSRPTWTAITSWLGHEIDPEMEAAGYAELVKRWLWAYGPGTEADLVWWLGATKTAVRRALVDIGAVPVSLQDGTAAWVRSDDLDEVQTPEPWAVLLPALDPTTMGWRGRAFYVAAGTAEKVYDRAGNGRPTAWWHGQVVGTWTLTDRGKVQVLPTTHIGRTVKAALSQVAHKLENWLDGGTYTSAFWPRASHC